MLNCLDQKQVSILIKIKDQINLFNIIPIYLVPYDFQRILAGYTKEGYRVIAIARKSLEISNVEVQKTERESIEKDLEFLGLIILENRLKPQSAPTIKILNSANIRTIMCTGDNILTGLSVARDCGMINEKQRIILVEAESGLEPKFSYADIIKQKNNIGNIDVVKTFIGKL